MTQNWQINCGILPTIYVRILGLGIGLGSVSLALHVSGLGLDTSGLVNIPDKIVFSVRVTVLATTL